jgi:hypothetical protein
MYMFSMSSGNFYVYSLNYLASHTDIKDLNNGKPCNYTTQNKVLYMAHHTFLDAIKFRKTKYHFGSYAL